MLANFYVFFMTMALLLLSITISWYNCHHSRDQSHSNSCFTMESFEVSGANYFPLSLLLSSKLQPPFLPFAQILGVGDRPWQILLKLVSYFLSPVIHLSLFTYFSQENFTSHQTYKHYNCTVITVPYNMWPIR